jgi:hypothetical protein
MENVGAAEKLSNTAGSIMDSRQVVRELRKLKSKLGTKGIGLKFTGMREIDGGAGGARLPALRKKHAWSPNAPRERRREGWVQLKESPVDLPVVYPRPEWAGAVAARELVKNINGGSGRRKNGEKDGRSSDLVGEWFYGAARRSTKQWTAAPPNYWCPRRLHLCSAHPEEEEKVLS